MNLLDGLEVERIHNNEVLYKGIIVQTIIAPAPKHYTNDYYFIVAILTEEGKIHVEYSNELKFKEKDLKKLREKAPEIVKKLNRFEIMEI